MAKLAPTSIKYLVKARIKAKGVIEKHDVIGAVFGQTEGLLGSDLDLRELQETGRIGRIEVNLHSSGGSSDGDIIIPSSLDATETALIAATLETIERVGPCTAEIKLDKVEDTRSLKRDYVIDRAKEILRKLVESSVPSSAELSDKIKETIRIEEISVYEGLPAGPTVAESDEVIIVEGRADILNLLKYGIRNTVAIGGTSVPQVIDRICREKTATALVDGDRGGELIVKELMQRTEIDFVAQAPSGREVEELVKKELFKALRDKVTPQQFLSEHKGDNGNYRRYESNNGRPPLPERRPVRERRDDKPRALRIKDEDKELFKKTLTDLVGSRAACIFDANNELLGKVPVAELENTLKTLDKPRAVVFDGKVNYSLNSIARRKGVEFLVGMDKDSFNTPITVLAKKDLE
ncbi:MAG: DNA primase [Nanoarchaeota archaeon]|nr:DNA primase [Nanoarchaeota archaeon]